MDRESLFLAAFYGSICIGIAVFLFVSLFNAALAGLVLVVVALFASMAVLAAEAIRSGSPDGEDR